MALPPRLIEAKARFELIDAKAQIRKDAGTQRSAEKSKLKKGPIADEKLSFFAFLCVFAPLRRLCMCPD
jgi:hypothetical protein